jgi:hypothetical protein
VKNPDHPEPLMNAVEGWSKDSDYLYLHTSGARIERRGYPSRPGWYLKLPRERGTGRRFEPTTYGCDQAFIAFAGRQAALAYLSRILKAA